MSLRPWCRALLASALVVSLSACSGPEKKPTPEPGSSPGERRPGPGAPEPPRPLAEPGELLEACTKHLQILHRRRLAKDLGPALAKLAGPQPTLDEISASLARLRSDGLDGTDEALLRAGAFCRIAAPGLSRSAHAFLAWTPDLDDVGLAKVQARRPGVVKEIWGKPLSYEVLVLDGFRVPDYPTFRAQALEHLEGAREVPRRRGDLLVIDASAVEEDRKRLLAEPARPERAPVRAAIERAGLDGLLREVEPRRDRDLGRGEGRRPGPRARGRRRVG